MVDHPWHSKDTGSVLEELKSSRTGLSGQEAKKRLDEYGPNELTEEKRETPFQMFLDQFRNFLVIILIFAAVISIGLGIVESSQEDIIEAVAILVVVLFITVVGFIQEYRAEEALMALKRMVSVEAIVMRDGSHRKVPAGKLVPGDMILLEAGDRIPADARLIEAIDIRMDEAALTGESNPVSKDDSTLPAETGLADRRNMVYMGTHVTYGKGMAVIVETGMGTQLGMIAEKIQSMEREKTPLQERLDKVGKQIGYIVLFLCILVFGVGLFRASVIDADIIIGMFMVSVALAVAAVPEGLPAVVTVTLAKGMKEMVKKNAIAKKLSAVETLGSTTVICSDKTGTLTRNEMTVRRIYLDGKRIDVSGQGYIPEGEFSIGGNPTAKDDKDLQLLLRISTLCNNAALENVEGAWKAVGDPTEAALVVVAAKAGLENDMLSGEYPRIAEIPFSSERKRMTTVHRTPEGERIAYVKGGPDVILNLCKFIQKDGRAVKLTEDDRQRIIAENDSFAKDALRILGTAYKVIDDNMREKDLFNSELEHDLVYVGIAGMIDPPREDAINAVKVAKKAGIRTVMITGDHRLTAVAVAKEMGIYREGDKVLTGAELEKVPDDEFEELVEEVVIYARVSPEHKLRIVDALKKNGHIVAMTGDGVNDAPALKKADIGIAMGITGTDVSKEAGDMVLVDDNFASIVSAIKEGRGIYSNIKLFIKYLISCNIGEVLTIFIGIMAFARLPLIPLQILWMNLLTDAAPALSLAWNPPDPDVMDRKPRDPRESIITQQTLIRFIAIGTIMCLGTLALFTVTIPGSVKALEGEKTVLEARMADLPEGDPAIPVLKEQLADLEEEIETGMRYPRTIAFTTIVMFQLFYVLSCRSEKYPVYKTGLFSNKVLLFAVVFSLATQFMVIYLPVFQNIFETTFLKPGTGFVPGDWLMVVAVSSTAFILPELWKTKSLRKKEATDGQAGPEADR